MYMVWLHGTVGRSSVSGRRTFPVLHSTCSLWVTTIVSKTICYILLQRLQTSFGLNSSVLLWFCSYLDQRQQHVRYCGKQSVTSIVRFGVPHGSILSHSYSLCIHPILSTSSRTRVCRCISMPTTYKLMAIVA